MIPEIPDIKVKRVRPVVPVGGLAALNEVTLDARRQRMLDLGYAAALGSPVWRSRKRAEGRDILALDQISDRFRVVEVDLTEALRAVAIMRVTVPTLPDPRGDLVVQEQALLGLAYPKSALSAPQPGYLFTQILAPRHVWHANVAVGHGQPLCLGAKLPAGIRLKEIVLMAYAALAMQSVMIDEGDAAGVLNGDAARWWQQNRHRIPLSRAAFLSPADGQG